jgi:RHS repeat-associated protein
MAIGSSTQYFRYDGPEGSIGNMTSAPGLPLLLWDHKNQLASSSRQRANSGNDQEITYYRYDAKGQRVRKVTEKAQPSLDGQAVDRWVKSKERRYYGPFEFFRRYKGDGNEVKLERQTLHIADEAKSFALIETRTIGEEKKVPRQVVRFQLSNAINSVSVELGSNGELLSYEEYSPYGDTTYSAFNCSLGAPKRYRYAGKEKDEESGLYYYGARYYLPSAMRWLSPDPGGWGDGPNLYQFVKCNPISKTDLAGTETSWWNRAMGAATAVGGALEIAAGAAGLAAPTGVTQVLGAVAVVHGADTAWAGLKQAWTGEEQKTYTEQGATKVAEAAGASKETAEKIGMGVDIAVGILPDAVGAIAKHGPKLLAKVEKAGAVLLDKAVSGPGIRAIEAGQELVRTGQKAVAKGQQLLDDARVLVQNAGLQPAADGFGNAFMKTIFEGGGAAASGAGKGGKGKGIGRALTAAEEALHTTANLLEQAKTKLVGKYDFHHIFPQEKDFRPLFRQAGINVHEFTFKLRRAAHHLTHNKGGEGFRGLGLNWNKTWEEWFAKMKADGVVPSKEQIFEQGEKMMHEAGLMKYWEEKGAKWAKYDKYGYVRERLEATGAYIDNFVNEEGLMWAMGFK